MTAASASINASEVAGLASLGDGAAQADSRTGLALSEVANPHLRSLLTYWNTQRGAREMPARADLSPFDMKSYLSNVLLVDVEGDRPRLRYRLVGTGLVKALHQDPTGRYIDEMPFWFRKFAEPAYADLLTRRRPHYRLINTIENWWIVKYERLLMPLSSDGVKIDMVLGAMFQHPK